MEQPGSNWRHNLVKSEHQAMATHFEIYIQSERTQYAEAAARECFREVDRIEQELSRFVESGSVARVRRLKAGETTRVHPDAWVCLGMAEQLCELSGGAFDCCYADRERSGGGQRPFALGEEDLWIRANIDRPQVDLGAVGKGYALDKVVDILATWGLGRALLSAGGSTLLALEPPEGCEGWPMRIGSARSGQRVIPLAHASLSGSGVAVKGEHIIDPRSGLPPATRRCWALARFAAVSDALSTACFILDSGHIAGLCTALDSVAFLEEGDRLRQIGELQPARPPSSDGL